MCHSNNAQTQKTKPPKWLSRFADVIQPESRKNHFTRLNNYRTGTQITDEMMKRVSTPCSTLQVIDVVGTVKTIWNEARTKFRLKYTVTCTQ